MSHFSTFVVGDVDDVMARFDEQDECYYKPVKRERENVELDLNVYRNLGDYPETKAHFEKEVEPSERNEVSFYAWYNEIEPCYSREELDEKLNSGERAFLVEDGKVTESYYFANPDAKYDYYCVVGSDGFARFQGVSYIMKDGTRAVGGRIGDLDIDATVAEAVEKARADYRKVHEGVGELHHTKWADYVKRIDDGGITIDEARTLYHEQEDIKRFNKWCNEQKLYFLEADNYLCTEEEYVKDITFPCFSANILGEWLEKAEMGWWAMTSNDKEPADWKKIVETALHKAQDEHPDEEFHLLDCHI
jgi:hypothetical protein